MVRLGIPAAVGLPPVGVALAFGHAPWLIVALFSVPALLMGLAVAAVVISQARTACVREGLKRTELREL